MPENLFARTHSTLGKRRNLLLLLLAAVTVSAAARVPFLPFDHSLAIMLPRKPEIQKTLRFLQEAEFSEKVVVSFTKTDPALSNTDLLTAVDTFSGRLGAPLVSRVLSDLSILEIRDGLDFLLHHIPEILGEEVVHHADDLLNPDAVKKRLRKRYIQLLRPEGSLLAPMIRRDPLDLGELLLRRLQRIASSFGYDVRLDSGHLVSRDGAHVLVILETPVPMMDANGSRRLLDYLDGILAHLPPTVVADVVCGHAHTVSNEKIVRADIQLTVLIATAGFLLLFLLYFRDPAAILILLIPVVSVLIALNLSALLLGRLSVFVVGLGAVIAGIAVDYAIHVYVAIRNGLASASSTIGAVGPVITLGALTTVSVFLAFLSSSIEGYRQLACFSITSVLLSLVLALFILPHLLSARPRMRVSGTSRPAPHPTPSRTRDIATALTFSVLIVAGLWAGLRTHFTSDVSQLDGSESHVLQAETRFRSIWGVGETDLAMLVLSGSDFDRTSETRDRLNQELRAAIGEDNLLDLSTLWPSKRRRAENATAWNSFWRGEREAALRRLLREHGEPYQFATDAFDPFFDNLIHSDAIADWPAESEFFRNLSERFVRRTDQGWEFISFFPDRPEFVQVGRSILRDHPDAFVASRNGLAAALSESFAGEVSLVAAIAITLIVGLTFGFLRSWRTSLIALTPMLAGGVWLLGIVSLLGRPLNIANLIAGIVALGLCIDYGLFVTLTHRHSLGKGTQTAVALSAISTLIGAGVLLFARHPALYSIGLTLVTGVAGGFVVAMVLVPSLCRLFLREEPKES
ncbi:MAG: MMPL family transporter [Planctomycetes bacterium]|nr:MMPL family transporter [Planctomycetota bacterium]